jgi:hypothetical protein
MQKYLGIDCTPVESSWTIIGVFLPGINTNTPRAWNAEMQNYLVAATSCCLWSVTVGATWFQLGSKERSRSLARRRKRTLRVCGRVRPRQCSRIGRIQGLAEGLQKLPLLGSWREGREAGGLWSRRHAGALAGRSARRREGGGGTGELSESREWDHRERTDRFSQRSTHIHCEEDK